MVSKVSAVHVVLSGCLIVLFGGAGALAQAVERSKTLDGFGESRRGGVVDARADVFARVRDIVSGGSVWDDASAGDQREASEGGATDHRLAEHRGGLALPAGTTGCGPVGDDLPDQRASGGAECGA